ncbi:MAG: DUF2785 domain-containing protein [Ignavibacteria bacterium]|nr:DUF2785 domain-containing protein [Ignavibacteria bacterium]
MSEAELKEKLQSLEQREFRPASGDDPAELIPAMLEYIGTTDSHLRDELIYGAFCEWILDEELLSEEQLLALLPILLDDRHLMFGLGEKDTDSVFTRSFSVLVIPLLLTAHYTRGLFSADEIGMVKEKLLLYLKDEKDRRGYVQGKGWAHTIAHTADALSDLVLCPETDRTATLDILKAIRGVICVYDICYIHSEEERLVTAVIEIIKKRLVSEQETIEWIKSFSDQALAVSTFPDRQMIRTNVKNFLQSLYFRLEWEELLNGFGKAIDMSLRNSSPFAKKEES